MQCTPFISFQVLALSQGLPISLGSFELVGIPTAPSGVPQLLVSFELDADMILRVSAKDVEKGRPEGGIIIQDRLSDT